MPSQVTPRRKADSIPSGWVCSNKKMVAWLCLSTSLGRGVRAFSHHSTSTRSIAFLSTLKSGENAIQRNHRSWLTPTRLAVTTAADPSTATYDIVNKEGGLDKYDPSAFESEIYQWWEKAGCFDPDAKQKPHVGQKSSYVLPMPPPNVTGRLHMGHAIFVALQDVLARFHRMRGRPVLWLPGEYLSANVGLN